MAALWARARLALWITFATALTAAAVTLVSVLISLPGQSGANISGLILVLLVLLVPWVVLPVAGLVLERRERIAAQQGRRLNEMDQLLQVGSARNLPRLSQLRDDTLGATPTQYSMRGAAPYVRRPAADSAICLLLRTPGPPYPFVIVWGDTKAGKSRTVAEALRVVFLGGQHDPAIVLPRGGAALAALSRLGLTVPPGSRPALVVLDDLGPADLESLTTSVLDEVTSWAVIVGSMTAQRRAEVIRTRSEVGAVARAALELRALQYELPSGPPVGEELDEAKRLYTNERFAGSIAETLVGGRELVARYKASHDENPAACAVLRAAVDCRRAGLARPVTDPELRRLFPLYLRNVRIDLASTSQRYQDGIAWACRPVASQVALLKRANPGEPVPAWEIFDHAVATDDGSHGQQVRTIPEETWAELIDMVSGREAVGVGLSASASSHGSTKVAISAFRKACSSGDIDAAPLAAGMLGVLLAEQGDVRAARAAYQRAIDSGHAHAAPLAGLRLALLLQEQGDVAGARAAYQRATDSGHARAAPEAALRLGILLAEQGDLASAEATFQRAVDSGHADAAPEAALRLGILLAEQGDVRAARAAYQRAIDSGHAHAAPFGTLSLGTLLQQQGDVAGARAAYQRAVDSGHADTVPKAMTSLGTVLQQQGDVAGARAAYQRAVDSGHARAAPEAALRLGILLAEQGDLASAEATFQRAIDSGHARAAPEAALRLGILLADQGDVAGARAAFQRAIDSGHADAASKAVAGLALVLQEQGDVAGARAVYQRAVDSGRADIAAVAALNLALLLQEQGDVAGARAAYQRATDSGRADAADVVNAAISWLGTPDA